jgi:tRNA-binding EMAP/Myf-like protein
VRDFNNASVGASMRRCEHVVQVDVGEDKPRQIASGLRQYYTQEQMTGRRIIAVCNLKPRPMAGFESQGMVLCAGTADRSVVEFIDPPAGAVVGERILIDGFADDPAHPEEIVNPAKKDNPWVPFATVRTIFASCLYRCLLLLVVVAGATHKWR